MRNRNFGLKLNELFGPEKEGKGTLIIAIVWQIAEGWGVEEGLVKAG